MTPNMVDGCGVNGLSGNFRKTAILTLELARKKKDILRRVLSLFLGDDASIMNPSLYIIFHIL